MTDIQVSHEELIGVLHILIGQLLEKLTNEERKFLLSIKSGSPEWSLMPIEGIDKLPAIQWKINNINKMSKEKQGCF